MDNLAPKRRSQLMSRIGNRNTKPEMRVRSAAHSLGLRYRLHRHDLPGTPDLVFPKWKTVVFVNGCFWHRHMDCPRASFPKSHVKFWHAKFNRNIERDRQTQAKLIAMGWRVVVIWECEAVNPNQVFRILVKLFDRA